MVAAVFIRAQVNTRAGGLAGIVVEMGKKQPAVYLFAGQQAKGLTGSASDLFHGMGR